jgi:hypothetical protein
VATLRWLAVLVLWAALDLSGPLLPLPVESVEEWESVAPRPTLRRRDREPATRATPATTPEARDRAARLARAVPAVAPSRGAERGAVRKLPPPLTDPAGPADDH